jgi:X-X-X-Leu-X-X-Gly heptad repeat protein
VGQALSNVGVKQNLDYLFRILGCGTPSPFGNTCTRVSRSVNPIIGPEGRPVNDFSIEPEITNNVLAGVMAGIGTFRSADQPPTAEATLLNGLAQLQFGLSNPNCDLTDPTGTRQGNTKGRCGIKEIQSLISGGIDQLVLGISGALSPGVTQLATGSRTLADGQAAVAASAGPLLAGIAQLNAGSQTLSAGLGAADKGGKDLLAGLNLLNAGGKQLSGGLPAAVSGSGQIADGAQQLADGLGTAADGSGQIADGLGTVVEGQTSVDKGLGDVREQAIEVLRTQFAQGTTLARQQLAGLEASTDLIEETPGAANTTYVLTQSTSDIGFSTVPGPPGTGLPHVRGVAVTRATAAAGTMVAVGTSPATTLRGNCRGAGAPGPAHEHRRGLPAPGGRRRPHAHRWAGRVRGAAPDRHAVPGAPGRPAAAGPPLPPAPGRDAVRHRPPAVGRRPRLPDQLPRPAQRPARPRR